MLTNAKTWLVVAALVLVGSPAAFGQAMGNPGQNSPFFVVSPWGGYDNDYGSGWGNGYHHASTAAEGWWRGRADFVRSAGQYNLDTSLAEINYQEAYRRAIDNRYHRAKTYFDMRKMNQYAREMERKPRLTAEAIERISKVGLPERLDALELNPTTQTIHWPAILSDARYEAYRVRLEGLFSARTPENSGLGTENAREIRLLTTELLDQFKSDVHGMTVEEFSSGRLFLESLAYESQFAPQEEAVAVNR
jgi:hypothetical protein